MEETSKENAIIIDGVKHILVEDNIHNEEVCEKCSLWNRCCDNGLCWTLYGTDDYHFEIQKQE